MANEDQNFYVSMSAYPRCRFFQQRINCFCGRAAAVLDNEMIKKTLRDPLLTCSRVKIIEHGNAKSKIHRRHFYAKKDKIETAPEGKFVKINVLTSTVAYEQLNQDIHKELNSTKTLDAILLKIGHESKTILRETEQSKAHEEVVTMIKQSCSNIGSELQISITINKTLETTDQHHPTHLPASIPSTMNVVTKPMPLLQATSKIGKGPTKFESDKDVIQTEALPTNSASTEDNVKSISNSEKLPMKTEQSVKVPLETPGSHSKSESRSPTKHERPISGDSLSRGTVSRPKSLRLSDSDTESLVSIDEDTDIPSSPEKQGHRLHRPDEHHYSHQQQQQQQQKQFQQQPLNQQQYQQMGCEPFAPEETNDCTEIQISKHNLGQAISYCIETKLFDLLYDVEKELEEVKSREDSTKDITDVDKLLYEVKGIYKQGITERCKERNEKNKRTPIPTNVMNAVLDIPKVIGFGRIYGRLSVHVQRKDVKDDELPGLRENIMKCLAGHNMAGEEVKVQLMVKKGSWCCITS